MATNIGNKLSTSGADLFFATLGMPNTSENMYKTVTYCDSYTGMESVLGTVNADTTYSKTQPNMVTGSHTFNSTTGLHTNIWTWNENSNTTGDDSGQVTGTFSLPPTSAANISVDGGTVTFTPTGLAIQQSPNVTSFRYIDEPITVTIGTHKDTYDYGGTVSFKTSDVSPKGIGQNFYNRDEAYYTLSLLSNQSWVAPLSQDINVTSNTPSGVTVNIAKQSISSKSGEGLSSHSTTSNVVPKEGGTKTLNLTYWNGSTYTGFTIPSVSSRTFNLSYTVTVKNSNTTPSGLNGTTATITQNGKTGVLTYSTSVTSGSFASISSGANTNTPIVKFNTQTYKKSTISGEISIKDSEISVSEYSDLANKKPPTASTTISGWSMTDPVNASSRTATVTSNISWSNVDTVNTNPLSTTYTFTQEGVTYNNPSGKLYVHITGDDMSKYPTITNANSTSFSSNTYEAVFDVSKSDTSKSINIQFPWIRPADIGGSVNGSVTLPDNVSDTTSYFTSKTWSPSISSNLTFVNAHVEKQNDMSWKMSIADFAREHSDIDDTTTLSSNVLTLKQAGNEYSQSSQTTVGISATSNATWLTPTSTLTLSDSKSSGNINFSVANNNANLVTWNITNFSRNNGTIGFGITSASKNTSSRSATITWKTTNSSSGTVSVNHNTSTYTQAASSITGNVKLNITGNAITGNSLTYTFGSYPVNTTLSYTVPSSRITQNRNYWDPSNLEIEVVNAIKYNESQYTTNILDFGSLTNVTPTSYTIDFSCQTLNVGSKQIISNGSSVDSAWGTSYLNPTNESIVSGTYYTPNLSTTYTCSYRWWSGTTVINNSDEIASLPSSGWHDWKTFVGDTIAIDVGTNYGETYSGVISKNSNTTLQGGWSYTSGGTKASTQKYFATQVKVVDNNNSSKTNTVGDFYYQYPESASSKNDKVAFTVSTKTNCNVSGNYTTAQVGSSIPSSVTISPIYSSGTKSWYKDDVYYGTSEPTQTLTTTWIGSICSNTNSIGTKKIAVWDSLSNYNYSCGVSGGSSTYTKSVTGSGFTKYYKYNYSATMYPNCNSSLTKTQSGTAQSSTTTVSDYSSSTGYNRYVSWDGGSTWGTTLTKTLSSNNYSLSWQWKYATSTSASGLYSGSGSATVVKDTSSTMSISGSISLTATSDTVYQTDTASINCSISSNTTSATETSTGSGITRSITTTTQIYYSTDNSNWTAGSTYSLPTSESTSTGSRTIYWKCVVTASGYSSTTKTFTTTSTIYVKSLYSYSTQSDSTTEYQEKSNSRSTSYSYSGNTPSVSTSGGGSIDYWTSSAAVSASSSSSTSITQTAKTTWTRQKRTGTRSRTVTTNNKTGAVSYGSWSSYSYSSWSDYDTQSSTSTSTVTGSITIQYSTNNSSWSNGSSTSVSPSAGSNGSSTGSASTIYFRALLYYGSTLVATGGSSSVSVSKYGVSYYNQ
jgi:trimeric autotransporter adhesin